MIFCGGNKREKTLIRDVFEGNIRTPCIGKVRYNLSREKLRLFHRASAII